MAEALLITRNDLVRLTALNGNTDTDKFIQFIKIAQDIHVENYLGTQLIAKLQSEVILANQGIPTAITVTNQGTGYGTETGATTTGGTGTGLTLDITATGGGLVTDATIDNAGTGYKVGDIVVIDAGNGDAEITIDTLYSIPTDYKDLLELHVKPMLIYWAMVEYLPNAAYTIANKGIYKHSSENAENVDKLEVDFLTNKYSNIAKEYTERCIDYIIYRQDLFPEYNTNSNGDTFPSDINNYGGWVL